MFVCCLFYKKTTDIIYLAEELLTLMTSSGLRMNDSKDFSLSSTFERCRDVKISTVD